MKEGRRCVKEVCEGGGGVRVKEGEEVVSEGGEVCEGGGGVSEGEVCE